MRRNRKTSRRAARSRRVFPGVFSILMPAALFALLALGGCSERKEEPKTSAGSGKSAKETSVSAKETVPAAKAAPALGAEEKDLLLDQIGQAGDFFEWRRLRKEYLEDNAQNERIEAALREKERELREKTPPKAFDDALELVAFDWKLQGENPGVGKEAKFTVSWLFYKKGPIRFESGKAARLVLRGAPDKAHQQYMKTRPYGMPMFEYTFFLEPGIEEWPEGVYWLVMRPVTLPSLPYDVTTFFSLARGKEYVGPYGPQLRLGWYADVGE